MRKKKTEDIDIKELMLEYAENNDIFTDEDDKITKVKKILWHRLNETDRRIMMIYAETASLRTTAKIIGVSVCTIHHKIHQIQEEFKQCI